MDIGVDQRCLGPVDVAAIRERILAQEPAAWTEQALRQQTYEVHKDTESIVMLFCEESWPDGEIYREAGWDRLASTSMLCGTSCRFISRLVAVTRISSIASDCCRDSWARAGPVGCRAVMTAAANGVMAVAPRLRRNCDKAMRLHDLLIFTPPLTLNQVLNVFAVIKPRFFLV